MRYQNQLFAICISFIAGVSHAFPFFLPFTASENEERTQQRANYLIAEQALKKNDIKQFNKLAGDLKSYPLYPYLELELLKQQLATQNTNDLLLEKIDAFEKQ